MNNANSRMRYLFPASLIAAFVVAIFLAIGIAQVFVENARPLLRDVIQQWFVQKVADCDDPNLLVIPKGCPIPTIDADRSSGKFDDFFAVLAQEERLSAEVSDKFGVSKAYALSLIEKVQTEKKIIEKRATDYAYANNIEFGKGYEIVLQKQHENEARMRRASPPRELTDQERIRNFLLYGE